MTGVKIKSAPLWVMHSLSLAAAKLLLPVPFVDDFAPVPPCMFMDDFVADGDIAVPAILFLTAFFLAC